MTDGSDDIEEWNDHEKWEILVPFLDSGEPFARGVEFGMWYRDVQNADGEHGQYVLSENEEQMRLACIRCGWEVLELKLWRTEGEPRKSTGWVWLKVRIQESNG